MPERAAFEQLAQAGDLEGAVLAYVRDNDYVTFVELQRRLGAYMDVKGDLCWELRPGVVLWVEMSEAFAQLLRGLVQQKRLFLHPANWMTYMIDGGFLRLPVAKKAQDYKKPHWLPVCLRLVPLPPERKRKRVRHA
jgi:hypothetical protein